MLSNALTIIVPNLDDTFNSGLSVMTTPTRRVIVTWNARTFLLSPPFSEISDRIESAFSDDDGVTFSPRIRVTRRHVAGSATTERFDDFPDEKHSESFREGVPSS